MRSSKSGSLTVIVALFLVAFFFRLYDIKRVGETWDEIAVVRNGAIYLKYLFQLDVSSQSWQLNKEHPPFGKYLYGATQILPLVSSKIANLDNEYPAERKFTLARLLSVIFGSLATIFVYLLAKLLYKSEGISVFSALIFTFLPPVLAHTKIAALESPLLLFTLISIYFFLKNNFLLSGLFFGFAIATKFNALFFILIFLFLGISFYTSGKKKEALKGIILVPFIALLLLILIWPWLWRNPIGNFLQSLRLSTDIADRQYFLGKDTLNPPIFYYFAYFLATTPTLILGVFLMFLFKLFTKGKREDIIVALYFFTPYLATFFNLKQDGIRYIFPFYPALAIGSSVGLFFIYDIAKKRLQTVSAALLKIASVLLVLISVIFSGLSVHPYYLDYYNALAGGPKKVYENKLFEIGWWGEGIREGILYINKYAEEEATVSFSFAPEHVAPILRSSLKRFDDSDQADYIVTNPYGEWYDGVWVDPEYYEEVFVVRAANAPITKVFKKKL